jgi:hypothetical protein
VNAKLPIVSKTPTTQTAKQTKQSKFNGWAETKDLPFRNSNNNNNNNPSCRCLVTKKSDSKNKEIKTFILMILRVPKKTQPTGRSRVLFRSRPHVRLLQRSIKIGREPSRKTGQETEKRKNNKKQQKIKIKRKFKQKQTKNVYRYDCCCCCNNNQELSFPHIFFL